MTLAIDGTPQTQTSTTQTCAVTLTTTLNNNIIILFIANNSVAATVQSVSGGGLTWIARGSSLIWSSGTGDAQIWYAIAANPLTSQTITVTMTASASYSIRVNAMAVHGVNTTTPFDTNVSLPATAQFVDGTKNISVTISTTNPNTMLLGFAGALGGITTGISRPSGFTQVVSGGTTYDSSKSIVSSVKTNVAEQWTWTGTTTARFLIVDALQAQVEFNDPLWLGMEA